MRSRFSSNARHPLVGLLLLAGCGEESRGLPPPRPEAMRPAAGWSGATQDVEIRGADFFVSVVRRLEGDPFATDISFRAWLGATELREVRYVDDSTLLVRVPASLPAGPLALTVQAPDGATGTLADAYTAFDETPAALTAAVATDAGPVLAGTPFDITLTVTNTGQTTAAVVTPAALVEVGDGATTPSAGPDPVSADLPGGAAVVFRWTRMADAVGTVRFQASATGAEAMSGTTVAVVAPESPALRIIGCATATDCDDGLFCTGVETCAGDACVPGAPPCTDDGLTCTATCDETAQACNVVTPGSCAIAGVCYADGTVNPANPCEVCAAATSQVAWTADDTNPCDDGLWCDGPEVCAAGSCVDAGPLPCTEDGLDCITTCDETAQACNVVTPGICAIAGVCYADWTVNPANPCEECAASTSQVAWTPDDTHTCDDGLWCDGPEVCGGGACISGPASCADDGLGCTTTCDEASQMCNVVDSGFCAIAGACHAAGTIDPSDPNRACDPAVSQTSWTGTSAPPIARFAVAPRSGTTSTSFSVDASASSDLEDPLATLEYRWDWESDGIWDTAFSSVALASHAYPALPPGGSFGITLEVRDSSSLVGHASHLVIVADAASFVVVTTGVDEADAGATPSAPGGAGFSLREAIEYANLTPGTEIITFLPLLTVSIASPLPSLDGATLAGEAGVLLDCAGASGFQYCLTLGTASRAVGLEIANASGNAVAVQLLGDGSEIADCDVHDNGTSAYIAGANTRVLGCNLGPSAANGMEIHGPNALIENSRVHDCLWNCVLVTRTGSGATFRRNFIIAATVSGLTAQGNTENLVIQHNTFYGGGDDGIMFPNNVRLADVSNNVFAFNVGAGIDAAAADFVAFDSNDYFGNGVPECEGTSCALQTRASYFDPLFLDAAGGDLRLHSGSPVLDLGPDLGFDVNGGDPGFFNGAGPDLGAWEGPLGY